MPILNDKPLFKRLGSDMIIDQIVFSQVPQYVPNMLSGDGWCASWLVQFMHKGKVMGEMNYNQITPAMANLSRDLAMGLEVEWLAEILSINEEKECSQPGCGATENLTKVYLKANVCPNCGQVEQSELTRFRVFCPEHLKRGERIIEGDADDNYEHTQK